MHGGNTSAHEQAGDSDGAGAERWAANEPKSDGGSEKSGKQGGNDGRQVVKHANRKAKGKHANVVHRPDAEAHGDSTAADPSGARAPGGGRGTARKVQRSVGRTDGNQDGEANEAVVVLLWKRQAVRFFQNARVSWGCPLEGGTKHGATQR